MATPPTFIGEFESSWGDGTTPKTTASITGLAGDVIIVAAIAENNDTSLALGITNSGSAISWTLEQTISFTNFTYLKIWSAVLAGNQNFTVSISRTAGGAAWFGVNALQFRDSDGVGISGQAHVALSTPSVSVTTVQANSALVCFNGDWSAVDGTSRTWLTINSITPTSGNGLEKTFFRDAAHYGVYGAYYNDVGATGSKTAGLSAPSGQTYSVAAIEVKGKSTITPAVAWLRA